MMQGQFRWLIQSQVLRFAYTQQKEVKEASSTEIKGTTTMSTNINIQNPVEKNVHLTEQQQEIPIQSLWTPPWSSREFEPVF